MISIISIINNNSIAKEFLLRGLSIQNAKYDLILIDNRSSSYKSAAQAYNEGSAKAKGDYLMFIHQDVLLPNCNWLKDTEESLSSLSDLGIAGVAGMIQPTFLNDFELWTRYRLLKKLDLLKVWYYRYARGNVFHGREKKPWIGKFTSEVISTRTLDELLLIVPAKLFQDLKFDESVCDNWHLYGVDYSLSVSQKCRNVCVLPYPVVHLSIGHLNEAYFNTLMKLIKKHPTEKVINTTVGPWSTRSKLTNLQICNYLSEARRAA
jgi:hypothetical protein